jgi:hypothetical protein
MSRVYRKSHGSVDFRQIPRFRHKKEPPGSPQSGGFGRSCCLNLGFCAGRQGCRGMGCRPAGLTESTNNHSSPTIQRPSERHTAAATALMGRSSPRFDRALRQLNLYIMVLLRERSQRTVGFIEPCLPSPAKLPPSGSGWIHEIKHDGFRLLARRDAAGVRLITRRGSDFTSRFPFIAMAVAALPARSPRLDRPRRRVPG